MSHQETEGPAMGNIFLAQKETISGFQMTVCLNKHEPHMSEC